MLTEYGLPTTSASGFRQRRRKPSVVCFWSREPEDNVPACHHSGSGRMTSNREIVFRLLDPLPSARHYCDSKIELTHLLHIFGFLAPLPTRNEDAGTTHHPWRQGYVYKRPNSSLWQCSSYFAG